jgi:hypothetical protein
VKCIYPNGGDEEEIRDWWRVDRRAGRYIRLVCATGYLCQLLSVFYPSCSMKLQSFVASAFLTTSVFAGVVKRDSGFSQGQPIDGKGKGAPLSGRYSLPS